jgi:hypothetical protein
LQDFILAHQTAGTVDQQFKNIERAGADTQRQTALEKVSQFKGDMDLAEADH